MAVSHFSGLQALADGLTVGASGTPILYVQKGAISINPPSIANGAGAVVTLTITGAVAGDCVVINPGTAGFTAGIMIGGAWVSAADTVKVNVFNVSGGTLDEAALSCQYLLVRS